MAKIEAASVFLIVSWPIVGPIVSDFKSFSFDLKFFSKIS